jgi:hypothetical protein
MTPQTPPIGALVGCNFPLRGDSGVRRLPEIHPGKVVGDIRILSGVITFKCKFYVNKRYPYTEIQNNSEIKRIQS